MIIFNWSGVAMLLAAALAEGSFDSKKLAFLVLFVLDVVYRLWTRDAETEPWRTALGPTKGGSFFYLPCWLIGLALLLFAPA